MYSVAVLMERQLADLDADQIIALHEGLDESVTYELILPVRENPLVYAESVAALGDIPAPVTTPEEIRDEHHRAVVDGETALAASAQLLRDRGQAVSTTLTEDDPVAALKSVVEGSQSAEAIILTEPHFVREFLHVDWTSRARRKLNVPTLHLVEHLPFAAQ